MPIHEHYWELNLSKNKVFSDLIYESQISNGTVR